MNTQKKFFTVNELDGAHDVFKRNGIVFFDKLLPASVFQEAERKINDKLKSCDDVKGLHNLHSTEQWFANFMTRSEFTNIAKALLGVSSVKVFTSMILNKPPHAKMAIPWHQDGAYDWPIEPKDCASLWLAFDNITVENGAMEVVVGAHAKGVFAMQDTQAPMDDKPLFINRVKRSIPEASLSEYEKIYLTMDKGCASFHHSMLPHRSNPNLSGTRRCALGVRYCRGDAKLTKVPGMAREHEYKDFELLECK